MAAALRGADVLAQSIARMGARHVFTLSGNQIMPVFDASIDAGLTLHHFRHEAAAVHAADAWARLTGEVGVALLTGGPGHANGISALYTALMSESPLVMLSGHAPFNELHKGAFQEMRQAEMAAPVVKAAFTAQSAEHIGQEFARAVRHAQFGRPGPVHLSLPFDVLEHKVTATEQRIPAAHAFTTQPACLGEAGIDAVLREINAAKRPLLLTGPAMSTDRGRAAREALATALNLPVICMESPRGVNDPRLGAFPTVLAQADLVVLIGKLPDFTLKFAQAPALNAACRLIVLDPDPAMLTRAGYAIGDASRITLAAVSEPFATIAALTQRAQALKSTWGNEVHDALRHRPVAWRTIQTAAGSPAHPLEVGRAVQALIDAEHRAHRETVFICDGGEFGQWAQASVDAPTRLINGPAGAIGSALPFAIAAKLARPQATVLAMLGDGTFGFHAMEYDTAVREQLAFTAIVGNDACWNAEHQIQLRAYGKARAIACELLPTRYDAVVQALGGVGAYAPDAAHLAPCLQQAVKANQPACVNAMIERHPAPAVHA